MKSFLALLLGSALALTVFASPTDNLKPVGQAKLKVWFWDIYNSSLYTANGEYQPDTYPLALQINYLRDIEAEDLIQATIDEWQKLGFKTDDINPWIEYVRPIWPDLSEGDELLLLVNVDQSSEFFFNQQSIGQVQDQTFGPAFIQIWLSENASYPKLRLKLIGEEK